jgi:hypothetical protein
MDLKPQVMYIGKPKNLFLVISGLLFVLLGINLILKGNIFIGIFNIIFFGMCLAIGIINFIPKASNLRIDERGLQMTSLFRTTFVPWQAVSYFDTQSNFIFKMVRVNLDPEKVDLSKSKLRKTALADNYGKSAKELAELLNLYKEKYS